MFEIKARDGLARICSLEVCDKGVETPLLLPVINPNIGPIEPKRLRDEFGINGIITNSFIISRNEEIRERALSIGLHELLGFGGLIMTDSGTFQEHVYGDIDVDPLEIVEFQRDIGSDIGTILDVFSEPDLNREDAADAVKKTVKRAKDAVDHRGEMWLAGPVQGSLFKDLREKCANQLSEIDLQVHPIGGVVPLMENYRFSELVDIIVASKKGLDPSRPVHLFGAGHPMLFPLAVLLGCDIFDSASYAKFARSDRLMFADGSRRLEDISEFWCHCPTCSTHSPEEIRAMDKEERERALAEHNLHACQAQIRRIKASIREGSLWELVERSCRSHPRLLDALHNLRNYNDFLEEYEPLSREGALIFTGDESYSRPAIWRYQKRIFGRYSHPMTDIMIALPETSKPYSRTYANLMSKISDFAAAHFIIMSSIGPVPIELDEIYPVAHFLAPDHDREKMSTEVRELMERYSHEQRYGLALVWEGEETIEVLMAMTNSPREKLDYDRARVRAVLRMQFGAKAEKVLENAELSYVKSKSRGRIRNVSVDNIHAFSIRARDGYISLTKKGAELLHSAIPRPGYRVIVHEDAIPFVAKGSNVFAKFVIDCDPEIRPGDDVLAVDSNDDLIAHGRSLMNRREMKSFNRGIAVKIREGFEE